MRESKAQALRGLYAITDPNLLTQEKLIEGVKQALVGGAKLIQYRNKDASFATQVSEARALANLCREFNALFIVNDSPELCIESNADGVHVGQKDPDISEIRQRLSEHIIGVTCHNSMALATKAQQHGADYVAFGSVFKSPTKPSATPCALEELRHATSKLDIPVCAIGGITVQNSNEVINAGASMIAMISGIFAQDDIKASAQAVAQQFFLE